MVLLPTLTITGPSTFSPEMSLVTSPLVGTDSNSNNSFEFDTSSGRPGTASSTGNDDGKPVHIVVFCHEEGGEHEGVWGTKAGMHLPRATMLE